MQEQDGSQNPWVNASGWQEQADTQMARNSKVLRFIEALKGFGHGTATVLNEPESTLLLDLQLYHGTQRGENGMGQAAHIKAAAKEAERIRMGALTELCDLTGRTAWELLITPMSRAVLSEASVGDESVRA